MAGPEFDTQGFEDGQLCDAEGNLVDPQYDADGNFVS
jgi:hypothetical protein